jgi:hypothetical protein
MVIELNDFIHERDNFIEAGICDSLVQIFESNSDKHCRVENDQTPNFTEFNLTENSNLSEEVSNIHNYILSKIIEYKKEYFNFVDKRCFPKQHAFEQFRIKKYLNDGNDKFNCHVDVTDHDSSRRFLSFLFYLNDVDNGGETVFNDLIITPRKGKMIVFPPFWMFPHIGKPPISNPKYILSAYLHYK